MKGGLGEHTDEAFEDASSLVAFLLDCSGLEETHLEDFQMRWNFDCGEIKVMEVAYKVLLMICANGFVGIDDDRLRIPGRGFVLIYAIVCDRMRIQRRVNFMTAYAYCQHICSVVGHTLVRLKLSWQFRLTNTSRRCTDTIGTHALQFMSDRMMNIAIEPRVWGYA